MWISKQVFPQAVLEVWRHVGELIPQLIVGHRDSTPSGTSAAIRTACRSLAEESTPRPTGKQADEDDDRRREVIDQGNRPLILEVDEEKPAEPLRDEHDRCGDAEDSIPTGDEGATHSRSPVPT